MNDFAVPSSLPDQLDELGYAQYLNKATRAAISASHDAQIAQTKCSVHPQWRLPDISVGRSLSFSSVHSSFEDAGY